eukprot:TRINITY_DN8211_c0_g1_i2.p1 TRINITY_DN8211_c0_g1~~TRINITY_DN8211_c0_g1_i2.p1  ORF type:complete len:307 (+),score=54.84 TRINITY_DN8211_c0_g1_i2:59-979(+)
MGRRRQGEDVTTGLPAVCYWHGSCRRALQRSRVAAVAGLALLLAIWSCMVAFASPSSRTRLRALDLESPPTSSSDAAPSEGRIGAAFLNDGDDEEDEEMEDQQKDDLALPKRLKSTGEFKSYAYMKSVVPHAYPVISLDRSSIPRPMAAKLQMYFDEAMVRIVDLVVSRANCNDGRDNRGSVLHALALLPRRLEVAAEVRPRRLRGLTRLRVYKGLQIKDDSVDAEVLHVSGETEPEKLAQVMLYRLQRSVRTVQLSFLGGRAAAKTMMAIEELYWQARNEIFIVPRLASFSEDGKASILVSVTLA